MYYKNLAILVIFVAFLGFCSGEVSTPKNNLNDCIKNVLSPTDYEKFLSNEITLEPYEELIQNCVDGNLVTTTLSFEQDTSLASPAESTTTTTKTATAHCGPEFELLESKVKREEEWINRFDSTALK